MWKVKDKIIRILNIFEFLFDPWLFWKCVEAWFQQYKPFFQSSGIFGIVIDLTF